MDLRPQYLGVFYKIKIVLFCILFQQTLLTFITIALFYLKLFIIVKESKICTKFKFLIENNHYNGLFLIFLYKKRTRVSKSAVPGHHGADERNGVHVLPHLHLVL